MIRERRKRITPARAGKGLPDRGSNIETTDPRLLCARTTEGAAHRQAGLAKPGPGRAYSTGADEDVEFVGKLCDRLLANGSGCRAMPAGGPYRSLSVFNSSVCVSSTARYGS